MGAGADHSTVASDGARGNRWQLAGIRRGHRTVRTTAVTLATTLVLLLAFLSMSSARALLHSLATLNLGASTVDALVGRRVAASAVTPRRKLLVVVVDGLRADVAARLPFLSQLARDGATADLTADLPTYSTAQYVSILTGVPPLDSGVRTNSGIHATRLDSVPRRVREAGGVAFEIGDEVDWWARLFGDAFTETAVVRPEVLVAEARRRFPEADLALVHLVGVDEAGHTFGASSPEYTLAARRADETTRELARAWGWPNATVAVLADHGHVSGGGHGGDEPDVRRSFLYAGGPGVRRGAHVAGARIVDVAPTMSALLGVSAPGQSFGRTLVDLVDGPPGQAAALVALDDARLADVSAAAAAGRARYRKDEQRGRIVRLVALLLVAGLVGFVIRRLPTAARVGLAVGALSQVLAVSGYFIVYRTLSFSADRDASNIGAGTLVISFACALAAFAVPLALVLGGRLRAREASGLGFMAVVGASPLAVAVFIYGGAFGVRFTCEPGWLAAAPLVVYAAFAPAVLVAAFVPGLAAISDGLRRAPPVVVTAEVPVIEALPPPPSLVA
jgi:hypothetical protein